jgi:hypothetical protein
MVGPTAEFSQGAIISQPKLRSLPRMKPRWAVRANALDEWEEGLRIIAGRQARRRHVKIAVQVNREAITRMRIS